MTWLEVFICAFIIGCLCALLLPAALVGERSRLDDWSLVRMMRAIKNPLIVGGLGGTLAVIPLSLVFLIARALPSKWRLFVSSIGSNVIEFFGSPRGKSICRASAILTGISFVGVIAAVVNEHFATEDRLASLNALCKPLGGHALNGRREYARHLRLGFAGSSVNDTNFPQIIEIVRVARNQRVWQKIFIDIDATAITDDGLRQLHTIDLDIDEISLSETGVTRDGITRLRQAQSSWQVKWREQQ